MYKCTFNQLCAIYSDMYYIRTPNPSSVKEGKREGRGAQNAEKKKVVGM